MYNGQVWGKKWIGRREEWLRWRKTTSAALSQETRDKEISKRKKELTNAAERSIKVKN